MSAAISPVPKRPYGVQRVCRIWAVPRSSFYHARLRPEPGPARPRGPTPPVDDADLLAAIQADLAASPFRGEGHRKVWARLRYGLGLTVGRNRVLRLMRDNLALSTPKVAYACRLSISQLTETYMSGSRRRLRAVIVAPPKAEALPKRLCRT
jgi:hypothetical protein